MKICCIFVGGEEEGLWSVRMEGQPQSEFDRFFDRVNDVEWLYHFFTENRADLQSGYFGDIDIEEAVMQTLEELHDMENLLYYFAEQGFTGRQRNLQHLFRPLNNFEYGITVHQKSKARRGWLRVYAIRLAPNCYLVTGAAIKLTRDMRCSHLQYELKKLERVQQFLRNNGIDYPEHLNIFYE